jgi:hypothetical protein
MSRQNPDRRSEHRTDMRTLVLTLTVSLFIALMAFFIILNSFSTVSAEKILSARFSLSNSFGFVGQGQSLVATNEEGAGAATAMEEAAAAGLRSVFPDLNVQSRTAANGNKIMTVVLKRADFDERWLELRTRIGDLMVNKNPGGRYSLQLLALDNGASAESLVSNAHELVQEGVDADLIAVGFENRGQSGVELRFVQSGGKP